MNDTKEKEVPSGASTGAATASVNVPPKEEPNPAAPAEGVATEVIPVVEAVPAATPTPEAEKPADLATPEKKMPEPSPEAEAVLKFAEAQQKVNAMADKKCRAAMEEVMKMLDAKGLTLTIVHTIKVVAKR